MLLASGGWRPERLLNALQDAGQLQGEEPQVLVDCGPALPLPPWESHQPPGLGASDRRPVPSRLLPPPPWSPELHTQVGLYGSCLDCMEVLGPGDPGAGGWWQVCSLT